ncbi:TDT family transporter [Shewanella litorisediminis]|uniref:TDT family transporter n=1 Tax=Shewanella litorisediminis TaxID=1173586 RepID=A0ABX7G776_9GAMM|nr:TDT family transporter [Shewanella litorisediminis]MCL2919816.1 TDT family transporter [Shewanella litorisediminis]QRH03214.1 TDT family transporter [Shewanella litorisediminis]
MNRQSIPTNSTPQAFDAGLPKRIHAGAAKLPSPLGGLALAIASLGWTLENVLPSAQGMAQLWGSVTGAILLMALTLKFILHPKILAEELAHPVLGSVIPTYAMGWMVVSRCVGNYFPGAGEILWLLAVAIHLGFLAIFCYHRSRNFSLDSMVPSWFVPPIGIIVAAVAFPPHGPRVLAEALLWFGMLAYLVMLPLMLYRLIFRAAVPQAAQPTLAILAAPASLSLAGYLSLIPEPSVVIVGLLLTLALLMTSIIYLAFFHLLRLPFSPGFAAFTFPMVIGATALFKTHDWLAAHTQADTLILELSYLARIELAVAAAVVLFVSAKYLAFYRNR